MGDFKAGTGGGGAPTTPTPEEVSLLMDGELDAARAEAVIASLCESRGVANWICYHMIGDAVRGAAPAARMSWPGFVDRLEAEPTVLSPRRRAPAPHAIALALAASIAAVGVVGWVALTTMSAPAAAIASAKQAASVRAADARLPVDSEYVLVHEEYSPTAVIQGMRPLVRAVAASEPDARP